MKKTFLFALLILSSAALFAQNNTAGKIFVSGNKSEIGKAYTLGSDKSVSLILDGIKAYNALDLDKYLSFGTKEYYNEKNAAFKKF